MNAREVKADGFYWYRCPSDDGPELFRKRGWMPVKVVGVDLGNKEPMMFAPGLPNTFLLYNLPGDFKPLELPQ